jgi:hypothetical protein
MSSRFLIPVLCVGAVVYACGPRTRSDAGVKKDSASLAQVASAPTAKRSASKSKADTKPSFAARLVVNGDSSEVRLAFHVTNTSTKRVEVNFPTGQIYDFVIVDSIGREVWHWGNGRMFTQTLRNRLLDGGEAINVNETWKSAALAPGRYVARGVLTSENYPMSTTTEFVIAGTTTVATREEP